MNTESKHETNPFATSMTFSSIFISNNPPPLSPWHVVRRYRVEWASGQFNIFWEGQFMLRRHLTIINRKVIYCIRSDRSTRRRTIHRGLLVIIVLFLPTNRPAIKGPTTAWQCSLRVLFSHTHAYVVARVFIIQRFSLLNGPEKMFNVPVREVLLYILDMFRSS
jgi:hypothetical protein